MPHEVLSDQARRPSPHALRRWSNTGVAAESHGCCFELKPLSSSATHFLERHPLSMCNSGAWRREEGEEREPGALVQGNKQHAGMEGEGEKQESALLVQGDKQHRREREEQG